MKHQIGEHRFDKRRSAAALALAAASMLVYGCASQRQSSASQHGARGNARYLEASDTVRYPNDTGWNSTPSGGGRGRVGSGGTGNSGGTGMGGAGRDTSYQDTAGTFPFPPTGPTNRDTGTGGSGFPVPDTTWLDTMGHQDSTRGPDYGSPSMNRSDAL